MTAAPVISITDELIAELEAVANAATDDQWELLSSTDRSGPEVVANGEPIAWVLSGDHDAEFIAAANPAVIRALLAERAELKRDAERYRWLSNPNTFLFSTSNELWRLHGSSGFGRRIDRNMQDTQ